jgi:hypothetical protein
VELWWTTTHPWQPLNLWQLVVVLPRQVSDERLEPALLGAPVELKEWFAAQPEAQARHSPDATIFQVVA